MPIPDDAIFWKSIAGALAFAFLAAGAIAGRGLTFVASKWNKEFSKTDDDGLRGSIELLRRESIETHRLIHVEIGSLRGEVSRLTREQSDGGRETREILREDRVSINELGGRIDAIEGFLGEKHGYKKP